MVHIKFLAATPNMLYFKTDFNQEHFEQVDFNRVSKKLTRKAKQPC